MAITPKNLIASKQAENSQTTQYTAPASTTTLIDRLTGHNSTASAAILSVHIVPESGTAGASNLLVKKTLAADESYTFPEIVGQVLDAGDFISMIADTASAITICASGREVS